MNNQKLTGYPIIQNGDHAEFEQRHINTPLHARPDWPLPSFDARDWAAAFIKAAELQGIKDGLGAPLDEGWIIGWFANALMRGFDEHYARNPLGKSITDLLTAKRIMVVCSNCSIHSAESCGHYSIDDLRSAPSGDWLCYECYTDAGIDPEWDDASKVVHIPKSDGPPSCADSGDLIAPPAKIPGSSDTHPPAPAVGAEEVARLVAALENARRDMLALKSKSDTGSLRNRQIEASAARISDALLSGQGGGK